MDIISFSVLTIKFKLTITEKQTMKFMCTYWLGNKV